MKTLMLIMVALMVTVSAQAVVVDDFTADTLDSAWVANGMNGKAIHNVISTTWSGYEDMLVMRATDDPTNQRTGLLRSDYSLGVGQTLTTDVILGVFSGSVPGLMIATTDTQGDYANTLKILADQAGGDSPNGYVAAFACDGADLDANFTINVYANNYNLDLTQVVGFYITRTATATYESGWIDASDVMYLTQTFTFTGGNNPGAAIGYTAEPQGAEQTMFDNLEIIPEPATMALLGLGSLLAIRRKK